MAGEDHPMIDPQPDLAFPVQLDSFCYWRFYTLKGQRDARDYIYEYMGTEEGLHPDWGAMRAKARRSADH